MIDLDTIKEFLRRLGHPVAIVARKPVGWSPRYDKDRGPTRVVWPVDSGCAVAEIAASLAKNFNSVYCNLNPLTPAMLKLEGEFPWSSVKNEMIEKRTRILIDIDSAGDKPEAFHQFTALRAELGEPLLATDSGNGYGLIHECDLPNTEEITRKVTAYLAALKSRFRMVDTAVASASRLTRVIGTCNKSKISGERVATYLL